MNCQKYLEGKGPYDFLSIPPNSYPARFVSWKLQLILSQLDLQWDVTSRYMDEKIQGLDEHLFCASASNNVPMLWPLKTSRLGGC